MPHIRRVVGRPTLRTLFLVSAAALAVGGTAFVTHALAEPKGASQAAPFAFLK